MNLEVEIGQLKLRNPVIAASGTFGYGIEYASMVDIQKLGAMVCKGTTLRKRKGNPQPRIWEVPSGVLNSVGLENPGVEEVINSKAPIWETWQVPVIVNIAGDKLEEYTLLASKLDGVGGVSGIEINLSCPNVEGVMGLGEDPKLAFDITKEVRRSTSLLVVVKLGYTPRVCEELRKIVYHFSKSEYHNTLIQEINKKQQQEFESPYHTIQFLNTNDEMRLREFDITNFRTKGDIFEDEIRYSIWEEDMLDRFGLEHVDGWDKKENAMFCPDWMIDDGEEEDDDEFFDDKD